MLWNTRCLDAAVARLRAEGHDIKDEDAARLSPLKDRHINFLGRYLFNITASGPGQGLRPFRKRTDRDLQRLERDILNGSAPPEAARTAWIGPGVRLGPRTTVDLARTLALAGGAALVRSRRDRLAAIQAAERTGDLSLTARIVGAYDVPAIWSRADDPDQSRAVVAAAERTLTGLGPDGPVDLRARLLATVAVESRSADLSGTEV